MIRPIPTCTVLGLVLASVAHAQQPQDLRVRARAPNFVFGRYGTVGASALYVGYGVGPVGGVVAIVQNPRTGYRELIAGAATRLGWRSHGMNVAVAFADASDAPYLQTYLVPSVVLGRLTASGTVEWYEPLDGGGIRQLEVNPVTALFGLGRRIAVGASWTMSKPAGGPIQSRLGPAARVAIPRGALGVEVLRNLKRGRAEVRMTFETSM